MNPNQKVVFVGLDSAGKTSILLALERKFSLISSVKPTLGSRRTRFKCAGFDAVIFDLGGQATYREKYIRKKFQVFYQVGVLCFVVDVTRPDRFEQAGEYFANILETLERLSEAPRVSVWLHKADPDIVAEVRENVGAAKKLFENLAGGKPLSFHLTTIHDPATVTDAFSQEVADLSPRSTVVNQQLREFAKLTFSSAVVLLDENLLVMGAHHSNQNYYNVCRTLAPRLALTIERVDASYQLQITTLLSRVVVDQKEVSVFCRPFKVLGGEPCFVVSLSANERTTSLSLKHLPHLAERLAESFRAFSTC
ncbi:MAG: hypothetical protein Kow0069_01710 [Promethearchaeota archaeon]